MVALMEGYLIFLSQGPEHVLDTEITWRALGPDVHVTPRLIKLDPLEWARNLYFKNDAYVKPELRPTVPSLLIL